MRVVPWITDGSVTFIVNFIAEFEQKHNRLPAVLEFGMGSSSLFFGSRSSRLVSFEHNEAWHAKTSAIIGLQEWSHCDAHLLERPYSSKIEEVVGSEKFDIILIDGRDRLLCLEEVLRLDVLSRDGVLVIDNTERVFDGDKRYQPMLPLLQRLHSLIHFQQNGADRTGWNPPMRWISTVAWRNDGVQFSHDGHRLEHIPAAAPKIRAQKNKRGLAGLPGRVSRSIRKRLIA